MIDGSAGWVTVAALGVPVNLASAFILCGVRVQACPLAPAPPLWRARERPAPALRPGRPPPPQHAHAHGPDGDCPGHADEPNLNMYAVLVHTLGDALSSVAVTVTAALVSAKGRDGQSGSCADGYVLQAAPHGDASQLPTLVHTHCEW